MTAGSEDAGRSLRWAWLLGATALALVTTIRPFGTDPDAWWHYALGRLITASGIPSVEPFAFQPAAQQWVGQQWLYEVGLFRVVALGGFGLAMVVMGICAAASLFFSTSATPRRIPGAWLGAAILLNAFIMLPIVGVKGQVITMLGTGITLWVLWKWRTGQERWVWLLPPLVILWCNLHAGFVTGLALAALMACLPQRPGWGIQGRRRPLIIATAVAAAGTVLTPAGVHLYPYVISTFTNPTLTSLIGEWMSPDFHLFQTRLVEAEVIALVLAWLLSGETEWSDVVVAAGMLVISLRAQRNIALFAVVAAPQIARYGYAAWVRHRPPSWRLNPPPKSLRRIAAPLLLAAVVLTTAAAVQPSIAASNNGTAEMTGEPKAVADYVARHYSGQRLYATYQLGGYLVYRFPVGRVVFIYGESAVFGDAGLNRYIEVAFVRSKWLDTLRSLNVKHAIVGATYPEVASFREAGWSVECYDRSSGFVLLSDTGSAYEEQAPPPAQAAPNC